MKKISLRRIGLVFEREYLSRVRKKSFIIMSILGPILIAALYTLPTLLTFLKTDTITIAVVDDSGIFDSANLQNSPSVSYRFINQSLDETRKKLPESNSDGLLYIPKLDLQKPEGFMIYSEKPLSAVHSAEIEKSLEAVLYERRLALLSVDKQTLESLKVNITLQSKSLDNNTQNTDSYAAMGAGIVAGLAIYMFIFVYASMVMRGVLEEKTNRIVEIIISSVRPVELMMGKILGVAAVAITQMLIWLVLIAMLAVGATTVMGSGMTTKEINQAEELLKSSPGTTDSLLKIQQAFFTLDLGFLTFGFVFYFIFGYLLYSALFAAIGASVDNETDSQQFMLPVTMPLVIAMMFIGQVMQEPDGVIAFWLSMIPLTSPVVMMIRLPYLGPDWQVLLSMMVLVLSFLGAVWFAARVYRVGILMYGKKPTYKELFKWLFIK